MMIETSKRTSRARRHWALALALAGLVAGAPAAHAQLKVGVVNVGRVMDEAPQAEAARTRLEREFAPRDREILAQQKELRSLEDKLVKNAAVMSESERQRQETRIRSLKRELRRLQDEFREDLNLRRAQELSKLQTRVGEIIRSMGSKQKYDLILTGDGVIHAGGKIEITDSVIKVLKAEFKGG